MTGEARILASPFNVERSVGPCTGDSAKQSQFREPRLPRRGAPRNDIRTRGADCAKQSQFERSVKFEVSSVKCEGRSVKPSDFTLQTSHFAENALRRHYEQNLACETKPI
jgi:hypothetical protein